MSEADALLASLQEEGELTSTGQFTLDSSKSRSKIAGYLEQNLASWSFAWVRAALGLEAQRGDFTSGAGQLKLFFAFQPGQVGFEILQQFLLQGRDCPGNRSLDWLRNGLLWLQAAQDLDSELRIRLTLAERSWQLKSEGLLSCEAQVGESLPGLLLQLESPRLAKMVGDFNDLVVPRLRAADVPLSWKGELISGRFPIPEFSYLAYYRAEQASRGVAVPAAVKVPAHHYRLRGQEIWSRPRLAAPPAITHSLDFSGQLPTHCNLGPQGEQLLLNWRKGEQSGQLYLQGAQFEQAWPDTWRVAVALWRDPEPTPDEVRIVDQGLLLDSLPLQLSEGRPLGWTAWVWRPGISTDLSGLAPTRTAEVEQMLAWVRAEIYQVHMAMKGKR
jgi:hypothetical protein